MFLKVMKQHAPNVTPAIRDDDFSASAALRARARSGIWLRGASCQPRNTFRHAAARTVSLTASR